MNLVSMHFSFWFLAVSGLFLSQAGPETPVFGSGSKNGAEGTQNQLRRQILMPFGDVFLVETKKLTYKMPDRAIARKGVA